MTWSCQSKIPSNAVNQFIRRCILRVQRIKGSGCSFCGGAIKSHPNTIAFCYTAQKSHKVNTFQRDWINRLRIKTYFYIHTIYIYIYIYYICYLFETADTGGQSVCRKYINNIANNSKLWEICMEGNCYSFRWMRYWFQLSMKWFHYLLQYLL